MRGIKQADEFHEKKLFLFYSSHSSVFISIFDESLEIDFVGFDKYSNEIIEISVP